MAELSGSSVWRRPSSRLGWWAVGLAAVFLLMYVVNSVVFVGVLGTRATPAWLQPLLIFYGFLLLFCGLAAGILGLIAILRRRERSWLVWLTLLPLLLVVVLLLGEFLAPH